MLSAAAEKIIDQYFNLPFPGIKGVRCPYYNNTRQKQRGQLRVLAGKGSPEEIVEESKIISIQYKGGIFEPASSAGRQGSVSADITAEGIRKFLVDYNLGVDCSGFVSQVLKAEYLDRKKFDVTKRMFVCSPKNFVRYLLTKLRPIENIGVRVFGNEKNSHIVPFKDIGAGDLITMFETGPLQKRNHLLLVRDKNGGNIEYVHARAWSSEGHYGHGVSKGTINIVKPDGALLDQTWEELGFIGEKNETYLEAKQAKRLEIRRLNF